MNPDSRYRPPHPSQTPTPTRETEGTGSSRAHLYLDDETLHRMIESFGPLDYSQFAATIAANENFGPDPEEAPWSLQDGSRRKGRSPRTDTTSSSEQKFLMSQVSMTADETNPEVAQAQKESLIQWFDKSVEKELEKRRDTGGPATSPLDPALAPLKTKHTLNLTKGTAERMAEASASRIEIAARLETDFTTELTDAVEKLVKAETMDCYKQALEAAEAAARIAPPELAEQAAAAEARRVTTQLQQVKETVPGIRPIEVVGYVGITVPTKPKKP